MQSAILRLRDRVRRGAASLTGDQFGIGLGLGTLAVCIVVDVVLEDEAAVISGIYVAAPFVTALFAGAAATTVVGIAAIAAAVASPLWNMGTDESGQAVRTMLIAAGSGVAILGASRRMGSHGRSERLRVLDSVGAVADGSLPLAETLQRVTDVIVPAIGDVCMVDAIHEGRVTRIATRAAGRPGAAEVERGMARRAPSLPAWLVRGEQAWRQIPSWLPHFREEELRRMAHSPEDLAFLRSVGIRSSIVAPIRARDRNLGALTLLAAWSGRRYSAEDVRFAQILASRIGLALDNAGLFSDLESVERRMDTVMSILDEAVVIHGAGGELVFANPAAARTLGYRTSEEAVAAPAATLRDRFTIRDESGREVGAEALAGARALTGEPAAPLILRATERATGRERWMRTKARAIPGPAGEVLYSVTAIEDVTEVKRAEYSHRLIARTGELLADVEDYRRTMERVPRLLVPEFADWCSVELPREDGTLERVALEHRDPERLQELRAMRQRYPLHAADDTPLGNAIRNGKPQLVQVDEQRLRDVTTQEGHFEALRAMEISSVIVAPMQIGEEVVGALSCVNHAGSRAFDEEDLQTALEVARRAALAIEAARIAEERSRVADALQRELLPPSLPRMPGWEVATMYEPAGEINEVGGDFYEVFPIDGGWAVVLGDVSGKGAAAAALTAEARHTIRTAGLLSRDPCRGLYVLDENLRGRDDAALCSVAMVILPERLDAERCEARVYLAGHPHPLLLRDGRAEPIGSPGPLLGVAEDPDWEPRTVTIEPGDQLVLYTDGVIEARGESGERFGTERLQVGLAGSIAPEAAVDRVRQALERFGARAREDDAAVVAIRRGGGTVTAAEEPAAAAAHP
jgi:PAS domain S-box-containing protein